MLVTTQANLASAQRRYRKGKVEVIAAAERNRTIDLRWLMREFGRRGWCKVLLEGGAHLAAHALKDKVVDRVALFVAPKIVGAGLPAIEGLTTAKIKQAISLAGLSARTIGTDLLLEAEPVVK